MLWKNNFHGMEKLGRAAGVATKFFHGMEKTFPWCGKVLWGDGAARGGRYIFKEIGNDFLTGGAGVGYNGWREKVLPRLG